MNKAVLCGVVGLIAVALAVKGEVIFTNRANVNLLNARDVTITATYAFNSPDCLRGNGDNYGGDWVSNYFDPAHKETITIDFKQIRNLKTIRTFSPGLYNMPTVTVQTSSNGMDWTTQPNTSSGTGSTFMFVLDRAVDARWLRITGESYELENASGRYVGYQSLRIYGDRGAMLVAGTNLDLVSSSAVDGGVTLTMSGWEGWDQATNVVNDNPAVFDPYVLYDWTTPAGDTVTLTWGKQINFGAFGFHGSSGANYFDSHMHFRLWGATDGTTFTNLLLDVSGGLSADSMVYDWDFLRPFMGNALRFEMVSATKAMISDFFAYAAPPSPGIMVQLLTAVDAASPY